MKFSTQVAEYFCHYCAYFRTDHACGFCIFIISILTEKSKWRRLFIGLEIDGRLEFDNSNY